MYSPFRVDDGRHHSPGATQKPHRYLHRHPRRRMGIMLVAFAVVCELAVKPRIAVQFSHSLRIVDAKITATIRQVAFVAQPEDAGKRFAGDFPIGVPVTVDVPYRTMVAESFREEPPLRPSNQIFHQPPEMAQCRRTSFYCRLQRVPQHATQEEHDKHDGKDKYAFVEERRNQRSGDNDKIKDTDQPTSSPSAAEIKPPTR